MAHICGSLRAPPVPRGSACCRARATAAQIPETLADTAAGHIIAPAPWRPARPTSRTACMHATSALLQPPRLQPSAAWLPSIYQQRGGPHRSRARAACAANAASAGPGLRARTSATYTNTRA